MEDQSGADIGQLQAMLQPRGQAQLLAFWSQLSPAQQQSLAAQIRAIDFDLLENQRQSPQETPSAAAKAARATSPPAIVAGASDNRFSVAEARACGEAALRAGRVGMILVAGGQGTRLGFDLPKGMFPIGPVSRRTLFQVLVDRLKAVAARYATKIPLFVMTSPATTADTQRYFAEQNNFGLGAEELRLFEQGTLPAVDAQTGQVLLAEPGQIALAPDGHGGMLAAFAKHIGFEALRARGIDLLFYGQIDNPLLEVCDPTFLGYHLLAQSELTTQVVRKHDPAERVGVVAQVDGHLEVMEYSDLSPADAARRQADGTLVLWAGSTAVHAMDVALLERMSQQGKSLPLHRAQKKVPYLNASGQLVEPEKPNAIKFERFIFDLMPQARNALVVEIDRAQGFAPVKNASGAASDTPQTSEAAICALHRSWLEAAGVEVAPGVKVEIHPGWALESTDIATHLSPGTKVTKDTFFTTRM